MDSNRCQDEATSMTMLGDVLECGLPLTYDNLTDDARWRFRFCNPCRWLCVGVCQRVILGGRNGVRKPPCRHIAWVDIPPSDEIWVCSACSRFEGLHHLKQSIGLCHLDDPVANTNSLDAIPLLRIVRLFPYQCLEKIQRFGHPLSALRTEFTC